VLTRGVDLNALVGQRFRVGDVEAVGLELAEPCTKLRRLSGEPGVLRGLVHRAGLRADVLSDGRISVGDAVQAPDAGR
jgi:MOSC domain-containing protein YiiM